MAVDLTGLPIYVDEQRFPLIKKITLTAPSLKLFNIQTGIKHSAAINILNVDTTFGDCACGWDPAGTQEFTQRLITVGCIKINDSICDLEMLQHWTGYQIRIAAGRESLGSFEQDFMEGIIADVIKKLDIALYAGDTTSADPNLNKFDGLLKILTADVPAGNILPVVAGESIYTTLLKVNANIPNSAFKRGNVGILIGTDAYRRAIAELTALQLPTNSNTLVDAGGSQTSIQTFILPGTNTTVYGVEGLDGTNRVIGGSLNNIYYGTDLESDYETIDFWYSRDNQEWRYAIKFVAGVQVALPDEIILASIDPAQLTTFGAPAITVHNDGSFPGPTTTP